MGTHVITCPNSVISVWETEAIKIFPNISKNIVVFAGNPASRETAFQQLLTLYGNCIVLVPYSQVKNFVAACGSFGMIFDSLTLDESHSVKNREIIRYQYCMVIAESSNCTLALSGK